MSGRKGMPKARRMRDIGFSMVLAVAAMGFWLAQPAVANAQPVTFSDSHGMTHTMDVVFTNGKPTKITVDGMETMAGQAFQARQTEHTRTIQKVVGKDIIVFDNNCIFNRGYWISVPPGGICP
jgi:hypothetical protein